MSLYAGYRSSRFTFDRRRRSAWKAIAAYLQGYAPESGAVLDLGSGYCDFIAEIRARTRWAVDLHMDPAEHAPEGVTPLCRDVEDLTPVPDASLDLVFASNLLEHLDDAKLVRVMDSVKAKLKAGGRFIALQPNYRHAYRRYFDDYTHVKVFTHVSLADFLASRGLEVERVAARFLPFSLKSRLPVWPWLVALYLRSPFRPFAGQMLVVARKP
jgi:SAM-dependent methyltransferase